MPAKLTRADLARMFPRALPEWVDALVRLGPLLAVHYDFTRLDWVHFCGQIDAETDGLSLKRMQEDMRFRSAARILQVYSYRLGIALKKEPDLMCRYGSKEALARALVNNPKELADLVYGGREGTPWREGSRYLGRGPTQVTHLDNYRAVGAEIARQPGGGAFDLVANPGQLADDPELGIRSAFADWHLKGLSRWACADDCDTLSDALNTGNIRDNVKPHGLPRRRSGTARAKKIWPREIDFAGSINPIPAPAIDPTVAGGRLPGGESPGTSKESEGAKTMIQSKTGNTAIALGTGGASGVALEASAAATRMAARGDVSVSGFLLALAESPTFWISALTVASAAFIWFDRRFKLHTFGI